MRLISLILLFLLSGTVSAQKVEWHTTTQTSPWVKQKVKPERTTTGAERLCLTRSTLTIDYGYRWLLQ